MVQVSMVVSTNSIKIVQVEWSCMAKNKHNHNISFVLKFYSQLLNLSCNSFEFVSSVISFKTTTTEVNQLVMITCWLNVKNVHLLTIRNVTNPTSLPKRLMIHVWSGTVQSVWRKWRKKWYILILLLFLYICVTSFTI